MRHAKTLGRLALITLLANGPSAPVVAQTVTGSPAKGEVPKALADAGEYGENLYDYAKVNDWTHAEARLVALRTAVGRARSEAGISGVATDRLAPIVAALNHSVWEIRNQFSAHVPFA